MAVSMTPSLTVEITRLMPLIVATESSTLRVTSVSSWLGDAPGRVIGDGDHREGDVGEARDRQLVEAPQPGHAQHEEDHQRRQRAPDRPGRKIHGVAGRPASAAAATTRTGRHRRGSRRRGATTCSPAAQAFEDLDWLAGDGARCARAALRDALPFASTVNT